MDNLIRHLKKLADALLDNRANGFTANQCRFRALICKFHTALGESARDGHTPDSRVERDIERRALETGLVRNIKLPDRSTALERGTDRVGLPVAVRIHVDRAVPILVRVDDCIRICGVLHPSIERFVRRNAASRQQRRDTGRRGLHEVIDEVPNLCAERVPVDGTATHGILIRKVASLVNLELARHIQDRKRKAT